MKTPLFPIQLVTGLACGWFVAGRQRSRKAIRSRPTPVEGHWLPPNAPALGAGPGSAIRDQLNRIVGDDPDPGEADRTGKADRRTGLGPERRWADARKVAAVPSCAVHSSDCRTGGVRRGPRLDQEDSHGPATPDQEKPAAAGC
jgi:hypothetical protein